ncbi:unnamed protein product [Ectocarpus sp. 12 AP-2014]
MSTASLVSAFFRSGAESWKMASKSASRWPSLYRRSCCRAFGRKHGVRKWEYAQKVRVVAVRRDKSSVCCT